jgi:hypothetical protein
VDVSPNVRIVDPVVTQLVTQQPRPERRGVAQEASRGWERLWINTERQPAEVVALFDAVYILRRLIPSMSSTADGDLPIVVRARCDQDQ